MKTKFSNNYNLNDILSSILSALPDKNIYNKILEYGPLEINCFSICFWIDIGGVYGKNSFYIKIPKIIFYNENKQSINNLSDDDRKLAVDEFESLNYLADHWDSSFGVEFVKTFGYIEKYNVIITKRINSDFFFKYYREYDNYCRPNKYRFDPVQAGLIKFGKSLSAFHKHSLQSAKFCTNDVISRFDKYFDILVKYKVSKNYLSSLSESLARLKGYEYNALTAKNIKGIDVRQIFMDKDNNNDLYIIDSGKITRGFIEVDIARFIVTCKILYWGKIPIFFRITPSSYYEKSFLDGYYGSDEYPSKILHLLIVKEMLKHWNMAHISLEKRGWNKYIKHILRCTYIDPFYKKLVSNELLKLE